MAQGLASTIKLRQDWILLRLLTVLVMNLGSIAYGEEILFEGYSKVISGGTHIGYVITRYELKKDPEQYQVTYYLRTNALGGNITESLRARAKKDFTPVSYKYSSTIGDKTKTIEAHVNGRTLRAEVNNNGRLKQIEIQIPKDSFFSSFLPYLLLSGGKEAKVLSPGKEFEYEAVAEEDAKVFSGSATVKELGEHLSLQAYRISNKFKSSVFEAFATPGGDVLSASSTAEGIHTELVSSPSDATQGIEVDPEQLRTVFGDIPRGFRNSLVEKLRQEKVNKEKQEKPAKELKESN